MISCWLFDSTVVLKVLLEDARLFFFFGTILHHGAAATN